MRRTAPITTNQYSLSKVKLVYFGALSTCIGSLKIINDTTVFGMNICSKVSAVAILTSGCCYTFIKLVTWTTQRFILVFQRFDRSRLTIKIFHCRQTNRNKYAVKSQWVMHNTKWDTEAPCCDLKTESLNIN